MALTMWRPGLLLAGVLLLSALLAPGVARAASTLRVGAIPIAGNVALYCSMEYGGVAAERIEIELVNLQSGTRIVEALAAGSVDIGLSATLSILQAAQQGLDLVIVAPASFKAADTRPPTSALVARKDVAVAGPAQLRGKTIAVNSLRSIDYLITAEYLGRGGVSPQDVRWVELGYSHIPPALDNGRVDAAFLAEPFLTILREGDRITILTQALDIIPGTSTASYAALRSWTRSQSTVLEAFLRAFRRGVDICERDPQRMRDAMVKHTAVPPALAQRIGLPVLRPNIRPADLSPLMELARRHGLLDREVNLERLLWPGGASR